MKKMNLTLLAAGLLLAGCSANLEAGAFSDLIGKFRPTISKMAAWRPSFFVSYKDAKLAAINNVFQEQYKKDVSENGMRCGHYYWIMKIDKTTGCTIGGRLTSGYPLDREFPDPKSKVDIKYLQQNREAIGCENFIKKAVSFSEHPQGVRVVAMCPLPECNAESTHNLKPLTYSKILAGYKTALKAKNS